MQTSILPEFVSEKESGHLTGKQDRGKNFQDQVAQVCLEAEESNLVDWGERCNQKNGIWLGVRKS